MLCVQKQKVHKIAKYTYISLSHRKDVGSFSVPMKSGLISLERRSGDNSLGHVEVRVFENTPE